MTAFFVGAHPVRESVGGLTSARFKLPFVLSVKQSKGKQIHSRSIKQ